MTDHRWTTQPSVPRETIQIRTAATSCTSARRSSASPPADQANVEFSIARHPAPNGNGNGANGNGLKLQTGMLLLDRRSYVSLGGLQERLDPLGVNVASDCPNMWLRGSRLTNRSGRNGRA